MANSYPIRPADEAHRLQALRPYQLVSSIPDALLDDLIRLAATLFNVPIAIVAFVDASTVHFQLNVGLPNDATTQNRSESLCSVAILQGSTVVFEDLGARPCELAEPGFVQDLNLLFYAGSPMRTSAGHPVGVLCVIDHMPRRFGAEERELLERLYVIVIRLLDMRLKALADTPEPGAALLAGIYDQIESSVNRLGTLAELAKWEEHDDTDGAVAYRHSTQEEIGRVLDVLYAQIQTQLR